jgi:hypothetical protein
MITMDYVAVNLGIKVAIFNKATYEGVRSVPVPKPFHHPHTHYIHNEYGWPQDVMKRPNS